MNYNMQVINPLSEWENIQFWCLNVTYIFISCVTDSNLNMFDGIYEKSVDVRETTDAHVACRCTEQCA